MSQVKLAFKGGCQRYFDTERLTKAFPPILPPSPFVVLAFSLEDQYMCTLAVENLGDGKVWLREDKK